MSNCLFCFNDTATTEIYTLSLHDTLPIWRAPMPRRRGRAPPGPTTGRGGSTGRSALSATATSPGWSPSSGSEEHTSELQSRQYLVCRLLLEKISWHRENTSIESAQLSPFE